MVFRLLELRCPGLATVARIAGLVTASGFVVATASAADVYRCVVNGRVTYADHPCGGKATQIDITPAHPALADSAESKLQSEANAGRVLVGMSTRQVTQAWGKPFDVMTEKDAQGTHEQWAYTRSGENFAVRFDNGKVAKITQRKMDAPAPTPAPALTVSDMEEIERGDKAAERRFLREGMTQEAIRGRLGPPNDRRVLVTRFGLADCWTYLPAKQDLQTQTVLCFSTVDTRLVTIERTVQR